MLDHVVDAISPQVDAVVIVGRQWPGLFSLRDRPQGRLGPLSGLNAALRYGADRGYDAVLSAPVDVLPIPANLAGLLAGEGPAVLSEQCLIGLWPAGLASALDDHLLGNQKSVCGWIRNVCARSVAEPFEMSNVNRRGDIQSVNATPIGVLSTGK